MRAFSTKILRFLASDAGPTAVEYAALFFLLVVMAMTIITAIGQTTATAPCQF
jgi:pilus assembly protein Flp/PilA